MRPTIGQNGRFSDVSGMGVCISEHTEVRVSLQIIFLLNRMLQLDQNLVAVYIFGECNVFSCFLGQNSRVSKNLLTSVTKIKASKMCLEQQAIMRCILLFCFNTIMLLSRHIKYLKFLSVKMSGAHSMAELEFVKNVFNFRYRCYSSLCNFHDFKSTMQ